MVDCFNIGVFYTHRQFADAFIKKIVSELDSSDIIHVNRHEVRLKNNVRYIFCSANDNARGVRLDRVYVEESVDPSYVNIVVRPMLMPHMPVYCSLSGLLD